MTQTLEALLQKRDGKIALLQTVRANAEAYVYIRKLESKIAALNRQIEKRTHCGPRLQPWASKKER